MRAIVCQRAARRHTRAGSADSRPIRGYAARKSLRYYLL